MFGENKNLNLKDSNLPLPNLPLHRGRSEEGVLSYTKTNKLITALYMVTDILDKDEPLRNKLRTLGAGIISDIHQIEINYNGHTASLAVEKISEINSFLDIASAVNIISEMNTNILKKEFSELNKSILSAQTERELMGENTVSNKEINIEEFLAEKESPLFITTPPFRHPSSARRGGNPKGQLRIGVQKGSTLLKALSDKTGAMSDTKSNHPNGEAFDALKKQRREEIINIIQKNNKTATIKDIKDKAYGSLVSCGEKTLQRELVSMVKDGVLNKTGEKRWSKYQLVSRG
jgi:hypothetical protein